VKLTERPFNHYGQRLLAPGEQELACKVHPHTYSDAEPSNNGGRPMFTRVQPLDTTSPRPIRPASGRENTPLQPLGVHDGSVVQDLPCVPENCTRNLAAAVTPVPQPRATSNCRNIEGLYAIGVSLWMTGTTSLLWPATSTFERPQKEPGPPLVTLRSRTVPPTQ